MDYCLSYTKPSFSFTQTLPSTALRRTAASGQPNRRRVVSVMGSGCGFEFGGLSAPLEPRTPAGRLLSGLLLDDRDNFQAAAREELERLEVERNEASARVQLSLGSDEACLHRRIAELKRHECREAVEDVMYTLILNKFLETRVHLIPRVSKCVCNGRLEILPSKDWELESIHSSEILEMVRDHIAAVIGLQPNSNVKESWTTIAIKRGRLCKLYAASILYGYFLKSASFRHSLEWGLESSHFPVSLGAYNQHPVSEIFSSGSRHVALGRITSPSSTSLIRISHSLEKKRENLRGYVVGFDPETIKMCAKPKSMEALDLIERHTFALFGDDRTGLLKANEMICTSFASLKRFVLEAVAFGSFLWETESCVNNTYVLEEN